MINELLVLIAPFFISFVITIFVLWLVTIIRSSKRERDHRSDSSAGACLLTNRQLITNNSSSNSPTAQECYSPWQRAGLPSDCTVGALRQME